MVRLMALAGANLRFATVDNVLNGSIRLVTRSHWIGVCSMDGQWRYEIVGDRSGSLIIDLDDLGDQYGGYAFIVYD